MAEAKNTFIKSKMNKDLDARLLPSGEYRDAVNIQVSRSEGEGVGSLENILGNDSLVDFQLITSENNLVCIGNHVDEATSTMFLFLTNYTDANPNQYVYSEDAKNFIFSYNTVTSTTTLLVQGAFLNFSTTNRIYGVNLLEKLLFWTDNRNQPRKINIQSANPGNVATPTNYINEDQISVAKYNPYQSLEMYAVSTASGSAVTQYETTMKDVVSLYLPNGGSGLATNTAVTTEIILTSFQGDIILPNSKYGTLGANVSYTDGTGNIVRIVGATVSTAVFDTATTSWTVAIVNGVFPTLAATQSIVLNYNPYYNASFAGDPNYLEDKFVRFGYRFRFDDNEYSIFSTFTQAAFIPKQDGYFMYVKKDDLTEVEDESDTYRSTIVSFVENKVNDIKLLIPLPTKNYLTSNSLKIKEIDILYKESSALAVKVIETIPIESIINSAGEGTVTNSTPASTTLSVGNVLGGINVGDVVSGYGIVGKPKIVSLTPITSAKASDLVLSTNQTISAGTELRFGDIDNYIYNYQSKKPFKTLPDKEIIRVYDKTPVRALAQEISSNRVIYGNFQDKHTPPGSIDYNVAITPKSDFNLNDGSAVVSVINASAVITVTSVVGSIKIGSIIIGQGVPAGTFVQSIVNQTLTLTKNVTVTVGDPLSFLPSGQDQNTTSKIEYPSSSIKTNRNYQVGVILSDRFGRQSTTILSSSTNTITIGGSSYSGSTLYTGYNDPSIDPDSWPGNSIKMLFNSVIGQNKNSLTGEPGIYNGDSDSSNYNPLGWYSYKIVVKQTEQEYYNVYLPGIMASYPENNILELGQTSHAVLINDNINKVPRDLNEVGPTQRQFRSSVQLFGRVENTSTLVTSVNPGLGNKQYYPGRTSDTVSTISTMDALFDYDSQEPPSPNFYPQFYSFISNPLIARISTNKKIGQQSNTNFTTVSAIVATTATTSSIRITNVVGNTGSIAIGDAVTGTGIPANITVVSPGYVDGQVVGNQTVFAAITSNSIQLTNSLSPANVNDILSGDNIPQGTSVVSRGGMGNATFSVVLTNPVTVTLDQVLVATEPSTIAVNTGIDVVVGTKIEISQPQAPGIQQLAVYETKPVESLLDIFWETSTSGLLSELNTAIVETGSGSSGLSPINANSFTEGLRRSTLGVFPDILAAPIFLVDNFGSAVPASSINTPLTLASVIDNTGSNVTTLFNLVETGANTNQFNIKTTALYESTIFFGVENQPAREFTFNFTALVNDNPVQVSENINLINQDPAIFTTVANEPDELNAVINVNINNTTTAQIFNLTGRNGSGGRTGPFPAGNPMNAEKALTWRKVSEFKGPVADDIETNFFDVGTQIDNATTGVSTMPLINNFADDPSMPGVIYTIVIGLDDPGNGETLRTVVVNCGIQTLNFQEWRLEGFRATSPNQGESYKANFFMFTVLPEGPIAGVPVAGTGSYGWTGAKNEGGSEEENQSWNNCKNTYGNGTIQVDKRGTFPDSDACGPWEFGGIELNNIYANLKKEILDSDCTPVLISNGGPQQYNWYRVDSITNPFNPTPESSQFELID